jgi:hypothetical protein
MSLKPLTKDVKAQGEASSPTLQKAFQTLSSKFFLFLGDNFGLPGYKCKIDPIYNWIRDIALEI